jgi:6-phosphogluconolactonase
LIDDQMTNFELISFVTADEMARTVADGWLAEVEAATRRGKSHYAALSGGRSAKIFFSAVVEQERAKAVSLDAVHFFWADERCVPPEDAESNFADARRLLFEPLSISEDKIHRIRGEEPPEIAAANATADIFRVVPCNAAGQPVLDLILLGIGEDGHVASLFPGEPEALVTDKTIYRAVKNSPKPPPNRVTLGYATIATAREVWVLASGAGKAAALRESLKPSGQTPLARVLRSRSHTRVFLDILLS